MSGRGGNLTIDRDWVLDVLSQFGSGREVKQYLRAHQSGGPARFAVIKVGGGILDKDVSQLVRSLSLLRALGLIPIIVHGAGPQLDRALEAAGIEKETVNGHRVTTAAVMEVARRVIVDTNLDLVNACEKAGVAARGLAQGTLVCSTFSAQLGLVGRVDSVRMEPILRCIEAGAIPIVSCLGESPQGQALNVNADVATGAVARACKPRKIIYLTPTGGLLDAEGAVIRAINLTTDLAGLSAASWLHSGMRLKIEQIHSMLEHLPAATSVSITSAANLPRELFTYSGRGTFIKRGEAIVSSLVADLEQPGELIDLIEQCFGRQLRDNYLADHRASQVIHVPSMRAAAVIDDQGPEAQGNLNVAYLDKLAVTARAQGEGLGNSLWAEVTARWPRLYWRCRAANPILSWYQRQSDWAVRQGDWWVLGVGEFDAELVNRLVRQAMTTNSGWADE